MALIRPSKNGTTQAPTHGVTALLAQLHRAASILLSLAISACSTSMISLQSSPPQAEIFAGRLGAEKPKLVGQTPLTLNASELDKSYQGTGPVILEFRKPGYQTTSTLVTDLSASNLTISLELSPVTGLEDQDKLNAVIDLIFEAQRLARIGRYKDSIDKIKSVQLQAPQVAASYEIEGGIYYMQKDYKKALDAYNSAVKYNPRNLESVRIRNVLEATLGVKRTPASVSPPASAQRVQAKKGARQ